MKQDILKEYSIHKSLLESFRERMEILITELIKNREIHYHLISSRLKELDSLSKKIDDKNEKYTSLDQITDVVGLRVITYLDSDVEKVSNLIESEFEIDRINSIDKRKLKNDQFGYKSLHYVVLLNEKRSDLAEYRNYKNCKFEIQVRTILQHSWAEIEHDLGYKGNFSIPDDYKRGFNRLSAILETADIEFDRLKKEITDYDLKAREMISNKAKNIKINQNTLLHFIFINPIIKEFNSIISKLTNAEIYDTDNVEGMIEKFLFLKIDTIDKLEENLSENFNDFKKFLKDFTSTIRSNSLPNTISIYYFQHFLAAKSENVDFILNYAGFGEFPINVNQKVANTWIDIIRRIKNGS